MQSVMFVSLEYCDPPTVLVIKPYNHSAALPLFPPDRRESPYDAVVLHPKNAGKTLESLADKR